MREFVIARNPEPDSSSRGHGVAVPDRGRLRPEVWDAYRAAFDRTTSSKEHM